MPRDEEFEKRVAAQLERLREEEAEKKMLYDRSTRGPEALHPDPAYIKASVGSLKTEEQLRKEARQSAQKEARAEEIEKERRAAVEKSIREHNRRTKENLQRRRASERGEKNLGDGQSERFIDRVRERIEAARERAARRRLDHDKGDEWHR